MGYTSALVVVLPRRPSWQACDEPSIFVRQYFCTNVLKRSSFEDVLSSSTNPTGVGFVWEGNHAMAVQSIILGTLLRHEVLAEI